MVALAAGLCLSSDAPGGGSEAAAVPGLRMELPEKLGVWHGEVGEPSKAEREILPEDTEFSKMNYRRGHGSWTENMHCSIVLSGRDRTSIHRPEVCLTGQGWNIDASTPGRVELANGEELAVRKLELSREIEGTKQRALYTYWFVGSDATTADHLERILLTAKDNIFHNRNPRWAYVSVLSGVSADQRGAIGQTVEQTATMLDQFIAQATPEFQTVFAPAGLLD